MKRKMLEGTAPAQLHMTKENIISTYIIEPQVLECSEEKILELSVYKRCNDGGNSAGKLMCRHFLKKNKEYATYFPEKTELQYKDYKKGWSKANIETVLGGRWSPYAYINEGEVCISEQARKVISEYLDRDIKSAWSMITQEEYTISTEIRERAAERKKVRIRNLMDSIEPMDAQFTQWNKTLLPEEYLFVKNYKTKLGFRCYCSSCEKGYYEKAKPKHNETTTCRKCGREVRIKTRTHTINANKNIMILQKFGDSTLVRHFNLVKSSHVWSNRKARSYYSAIEKIRMFLKDGQIKAYYRNGNERLDGSEWTDKSGGMTADTWSYLYPADIQECPMEKGIKTALMQAADSGRTMAYYEIIRQSHMREKLEYLIKGRLYRLASEVARAWWIPMCMNKGAQTVQDMLLVNKQRVLRLRELDGGIDALKALQWEEQHQEKISQENLCYINNGKISIESIEVLMERTGLSINRILNYIRRQQEKEKTSASRITRMYTDYLDMAQRRNANLHDDIIRVTPRLKEFHDLYAEELQREKDEKRVQEANSNFNGIERDYERNCKLFAWSDEKYSIVVPETAGQIIEEGRVQHHCVGASDSYMRRMHNRETYILFLREKKAPEKAWYTLEVTEALEIKQKYAAYDRQPDIKKVISILSKWKKEIQARRRGKLKSISMQAAV